MTRPVYTPVRMPQAEKLYKPIESPSESVWVQNINTNDNASRAKSISENESTNENMNFSELLDFLQDQRLSLLKDIY